MSKNKNIAKVSNDFLESLVKSNNTTALKLIFYIAKSNLSVQQGDIMKFSVDTKAMCEYCQVDMKTLKRNLKKMTETSVHLQREDGEYFISLLPHVKLGYDGQLEVRMFTMILSEIIAVQNRFTIIDVQNIMSLNSKHSIKMIQLLERINNFSANVAKRKRYDLDELNALFGVKYVRIGHFISKIIVPAMEELDQYSKLSFDYSVEYDKKNITTAGRSKAVAVVIDLRNNTPRPLLF